MIGSERFLETYLSADLSTCEQRDPKGLYAKARNGRISDFTGVSAPYEPPQHPALVARHRVAERRRVRADRSSRLSRTVSTVFDVATILSGFGVGVIVGLTGIGGGALMTPVLVLIFGVAPHTAVGTDLLFACITKVFGVLVHGRRGTVDWQVVRRLASGSLPAALAIVVLLANYGAAEARNEVILTGVGIALMLTAPAGLCFAGDCRRSGSRSARVRRPSSSARSRRSPCWPGRSSVALVALTSVGAGALGTVALVYLYPFRLTAAKLVGTDLAHAIPLALVAGAGHLMLGNTDFALLGNLLVGLDPRHPPRVDAEHARARGADPQCDGGRAAGGRGQDAASVVSVSRGCRSGYTPPCGRAAVRRTRRRRRPARSKAPADRR